MMVVVAGEKAEREIKWLQSLDTRVKSIKSWEMPKQPVVESTAEAGAGTSCLSISTVRKQWLVRRNVSRELAGASDAGTALVAVTGK